MELHLLMIFRHSGKIFFRSDKSVVKLVVKLMRKESVRTVHSGAARFFALPAKAIAYCVNQRSKAFAQINSS